MTREEALAASLPRTPSHLPSSLIHDMRFSGDLPDVLLSPSSPAAHHEEEGRLLQGSCHECGSQA